jgi:regulator of protease activity HflC (stomatin/prohibitin superfamily)
MNEINAQQRYKEANLAKGEAEKILVVKQAEAEAESKKLQGEGIANQRKAIVEGLKSAIADFKEGVGEVSAKEVMVLILLTQYFDMMKAVGESSKSSTILIPHTPGFLGDLTNQITEAIAVGAKIAEEKKTG